MHVTISFKHLEHTSALDQKVRQKSAHFEKYLEGESEVKWTCWVEDSTPKLHKAQIHISAAKTNFFVTAESENLYKCLDEAVEKMEKQLRKHKEMWKNHLHLDHEIVIRDPGEAWDSYPEVGWGDFKKAMYKDNTLE